LSLTLSYRHHRRTYVRFYVLLFVLLVFHKVRPTTLITVGRPSYYTISPKTRNQF